MEGLKQFVMLAAALAVAAPGLGAQAEEATARDAYFRAVARYFEVPRDEIDVLRQWRLPADEIPVVLFVARWGGVSPDALVALRRSGRAWWDLASRYHVEPGTFYVPVPGDVPTHRLESAYRQFRDLPAGEWSRVSLEDGDVVALVNVRILSETLDMTPGRILAEAGASDSFVELYGRLLRRSS